MKKCAACGELKPEDEFHWASKEKNRRHGYCKSCNRAKQRGYERRSRGLPEDAELRPGQRPAEIGSTRMHKGYVLEKVGQDRSAHLRADKNGWVPQHLLVAEKKYGILIPRTFTVHHRDRVKTNNDAANLELRVGQHGKGGDLMPSLLVDPEAREQAISVLREMGYTVEKGK